MTCNPFTTVAAKNSPRLLTPDNIQIKNFQDVINFELDPTKKYNREKLNTVVSGLNDVLRRTDISELDILNERIKQAPINSVDVAEFLDSTGRNIDDVIDIINTENDRRKTLTGEADVVRGTVGDFDVINYPRDNGPGIYNKVPSYIENNSTSINGTVRGTIDESGFFEGNIYNFTGTLVNNETKISGSAFAIDGFNGVYKFEGVIQKITPINTGTDNITITDTTTSALISGNLIGNEIPAGNIIFDGNFFDNSAGGSGATFNVVIGNNGQPIISIADAGEGYNRGDTVIIEDLNIAIQVTETINLVSPVQIPGTGGTGGTGTGGTGTGIGGTGIGGTGIGTGTGIGGTGIGGTGIGGTGTGGITQIPPFAIQPFIPLSSFDGANPFANADQFPNGFFPSTPFVDLLNSLNNFLNDNYGSSITSGSCGKFNLSILAKLFELAGSIGQFKAQITSLVGDVWNGLKEFVTSLPGLLNGLKQSLMKVVDNIVNQAKQAIEGFKQAFKSVGTALQSLSKEFSNLSKFFSKENIQKIKNVASSIMQNMTDQFKNPGLAIIEWILTRLCQLSDFLSNFLNAPIQAFKSIVNNIKATTNSLLNFSNISIAGAAAAGAVRIPFEQAQKQAASAAQRSNSATASTSSPTSSSPPRIAALPITQEDLAAVQQNVTENGWPGYFDFTARVKNNNRDVDESYLEGAGWKVIVRDNPLLFAKIKNVISEVGGGPYTISSAFRSIGYNEEQDGAAKSSAHTEGLALDILMSPQQAIRFVPVASGNGFNGISYYPGSGFLHVDLRRRDAPGARSWTADQLSGELRNVINNHQNKLYSR